MAGNLNHNVMVNGTLASSAATADQIILTYTVSAGMTLYLSYFEANVRLTTFATTATNFGALSLAVNGIKKLTFTVLAGQGVLASPMYAEFPDALPLQAGDVVTAVCTPSGVTPFTWEANIGGFEK
jgi:hypothetical protein